MKILDILKEDFNENREIKDIMNINISEFKSNIKELKISKFIKLKMEKVIDYEKLGYEIINSFKIASKENDVRKTKSLLNKLEKLNTILAHHAKSEKLIVRNRNKQLKESSKEQEYGLFKYHANPKSLPDYEKSYNTVPELVWKRYRNKPKELKKREHILAKDYQIAHWYALEVLRKPFPLGEEAISKDAQYSYYYAKYVLKGRFELGEAAISKDEHWNQKYQEFLKTLKK